MKSSIAVLFAVAVIAAAEPPRFRGNLRFQSQFARQEESPKQDAETVSGPYPPSGWKPTGAKFELPPRSQETTPAEKYGPPAEVYGPPTTEVAGETTTEVTDAETTTPPPTAEAEALKEQNQQGSFYVLLPNSRLQRLVYNVQADPARQQYSSKYQSTGVQQLSGPVFAQVYTPQYVQLS